MLMMAKNLMIKAEDSSSHEDRYEASASLILLQDALELIFHALIIELKIDHERDGLEKATFEQLMGELKKAGFPVPKSGTMKALNKQRVLVKHYGQISEPTAVANYFHSAHESIDALLSKVFGKKLFEIAHCDALSDCPAKEFLNDAQLLIEAGKFYEALVEIRKAVFLEIENDYNIYEWRTETAGKSAGILGALLKGGMKAPYYTRNKQWIEGNVREPFDFVQIDHICMRRDMVEWGVSPEDYWNLSRLTPKAVKLNSYTNWLVGENYELDLRAHSRKNATYCLDRAVMVIVRKQRYQAQAKWVPGAQHRRYRVIKDRTKVFTKADIESQVLAELQAGDELLAIAKIPSWTDNLEFLKVSFVDDDSATAFSSKYVVNTCCELVECVSEETEL